MAEFTKFKGYEGDEPPEPTIPKPEVPPEPMIVTVQEGVPGRRQFSIAVSRFTGFC